MNSKTQIVIKATETEKPGQAGIFMHVQGSIQDLIELLILAQIGKPEIHNLLDAAVNNYHDDETRKQFEEREISVDNLKNPKLIRELEN